MAEVNEEIVRIFFEQCGFLVKTNVKYIMVKKGIPGESDVDLVVCNLSPDRMHPPDSFVLGVDDLRGIEYGAVEVKGWHTTTISPSAIRRFPRLLHFVRPEAKRAVTDFLRTAHFASILVVSRLTSKPNEREEACRILKEAGVDHVIEFRTILGKIISEVEPRRPYRESVMLQTIRLLKSYGWLGAGDIGEDGSEKEK